MEAFLLNPPVVIRDKSRQVRLAEHLRFRVGQKRMDEVPNRSWTLRVLDCNEAILVKADLNFEAIHKEFVPRINAKVSHALLDMVLGIIIRKPIHITTFAIDASWELGHLDLHVQVAFPSPYIDLHLF